MVNKKNYLILMSRQQKRQFIVVVLNFEIIKICVWNLCLIRLKDTVIKVTIKIEKSCDYFIIFVIKPYSINLSDNVLKTYPCLIYDEGNLLFSMQVLFYNSKERGSQNKIK